MKQMSCKLCFLFLHQKESEHFKKLSPVGTSLPFCTMGHTMFSSVQIYHDYIKSGNLLIIISIFGFSQRQCLFHNKKQYINSNYKNYEYQSTDIVCI
jgi:hypothetical protein